MRQKINRRISEWGLIVNILKTQYLSVGSDIQNIKLERNIEIKGKRPYKYLGSIVTNSGKGNEEGLNKIQQARKATTALNRLLWSKYISVNTRQ
jgi:hypothetical protein